MEAVNGVSEVDKGGPPAPSPLTGCYLLIVVGEPHSKEHKDIILQRIAKGLLSWDANHSHVNLEKELLIITDQAPEGEDARYGERLIQFASENLVTEVLIHPAISTLSQCMKNLLSSFTRHRHIIHAGYTFAGNGSWILQDGTFSLTDFSEAFQEIDVQRVLRAYDNTISLDIHCSPEGDWNRLPKEPFTKNSKVRVNPDDVLTSGSPAIVNFLNYISPFLIPTDIEMLLESSDVVGNIRFSHPTLYVFPGGQGDAALFGINGFNMLVDGGFGRKACFWDFVRHLDRLDAVLLTRLNNSNVNGISSVLRRKRHNTVYPQVGHFFCNIQEKKATLSPDGDKDKDSLLINLFEEGQDIVNNLRQLNLQPQSCYRDIDPINLYHKVGHGTLDMYILSPSRDSKEVREFLQKWNTNDQKLFANQRNGKEFIFPTYNLVSICALLVWQPANTNDNITRILFPGSSPQHKIFEGLDKIKQLECIKYPSCSAKTLSPNILKTKLTKPEKIIQEQKEMKLKPPAMDMKPKMENKILDENIKNGHTNGVTNNQIITEKLIKKHDSTESDKSGPQSLDIKKSDAEIVNGKAPDEKIAEKAKPRAKPEQKVKPDVKSSKNVRSIERKVKAPIEKKASPTTPKKTVETKMNGDIPSKAKPPFAAKTSPSATPAKSAKEANNRKVVESKYKTAPKKDVSKPAEKKDVKPERKPISRRPKGTSPIGKAPESPVKKVSELHKVEARKPKLEKECTTDSSTVSTPSADVETAMKKDLSKLTPEEFEQIKQRELAELKEEQEVVKEIEAVFRKSEAKREDNSDMRKVKSISIDDKTEGDGEEYLIIEKEEIEHDSLDEKDTKESETQKHMRDSEESEKQRKLSDVMESVDIKDKTIEKEEEKLKQEASDVVHLKDEKETIKPLSKDISATSPDDKIEESSGKRTSDKEHEEDNKDMNILESQPDEKYSTPIESGATTAPTLPEDERIPLDEIKEDNGDQVIEEKYAKEDTKEKEIPVVQLPLKSVDAVNKIPNIVGIRLDRQTPMRDIVKTPDEVADLPVHEVVDIENYDQYQATQAQTLKQEDVAVKDKIELEEQKPDNDAFKKEEVKKDSVDQTDKSHVKDVEKPLEKVQLLDDIQDEKVIKDEVKDEKDKLLEKIKVHKPSKEEITVGDVKIVEEIVDGKTREEETKIEQVKLTEEVNDIKDKEEMKLDEVKLKEEIKYEASEEEVKVGELKLVKDIKDDKTSNEETKVDEVKLVEEIKDNKASTEEIKVDEPKLVEEKADDKIGQNEIKEQIEDEKNGRGEIKSDEVELIEDKNYDETKQEETKVVAVKLLEDEKITKEEQNMEVTEIEVKEEKTTLEEKVIVQKDPKETDVKTEKPLPEADNSEQKHEKGVDQKSTEKIEINEKEQKADEKITSEVKFEPLDEHLSLEKEKHLEDSVRIHDTSDIPKHKTTEKTSEVDKIEDAHKKVDNELEDDDGIHLREKLDKEDDLDDFVELMKKPETFTSTHEDDDTMDVKQLSHKVEMEHTALTVETQVFKKDVKEEAKETEDEKEKDTTEELKFEKEEETHGVIEDVQLAEKIQLIEAHEIMKDVKNELDAIESEVIDQIEDQEVENKVVKVLHDAKEIIDSITKAVEDTDYHKDEKKEPELVCKESIEEVHEDTKDIKNEIIKETQTVETSIVTSQLEITKDENAEEVKYELEKDIKEQITKDIKLEEEVNTIELHNEQKLIQELLTSDDNLDTKNHEGDVHETSLQVDTTRIQEEFLSDDQTSIKSFRDDSLEISKIDKKLQELKDSVGSDTPPNTKTESKLELDILDKMELGRKSPKEREQDVAKIVASVAEVLKSDAPLEEFEGKIPLGGFNTLTPPYPTELRETHITTLESPIRDVVVESTITMDPIEEEKILDPTSVFINEERKISEVHTDYDSLKKESDTRVSSLLKDSKDFIQATSKMLSDIKQSAKVDALPVIEQEDTTTTAAVGASDDAKTHETNQEVVTQKPSSSQVSPDLAGAIEKSADLIKGIVSSIEHVCDSVETKTLDAQKDTSLEVAEITDESKLLSRTERTDGIHSFVPLSITNDIKETVETHHVVPELEMVPIADATKKSLVEVTTKKSVIEEDLSDKIQKDDFDSIIVKSKSPVSSGKASPDTLEDKRLESKGVLETTPKDIMGEITEKLVTLTEHAEKHLEHTKETVTIKPTIEKQIISSEKTSPDLINEKDLELQNSATKVTELEVSDKPIVSAVQVEKVLEIGATVLTKETTDDAIDKVLADIVISDMLPQAHETTKGVIVLHEIEETNNLAQELKTDNAKDGFKDIPSAEIVHLYADQDKNLKGKIEVEDKSTPTDFTTKDASVKHKDSLDNDKPDVEQTVIKDISPTRSRSESPTPTDRKSSLVKQDTTSEPKKVSTDETVLDSISTEKDSSALQEPDIKSISSVASGKTSPTYISELEKELVEVMQKEIVDIKTSVIDTETIEDIHKNKVLDKISEVVIGDKEHSKKQLEETITADIHLPKETVEKQHDEPALSDTHTPSVVAKLTEDKKEDNNLVEKSTSNLKDFETEHVLEKDVFLDKSTIETKEKDIERQSPESAYVEKSQIVGKDLLSEPQIEKDAIVVLEKTDTQTKDVKHESTKVETTEHEFSKKDVTVLEKTVIDPHLESTQVKDAVVFSEKTIEETKEEQHVREETKTKETECELKSLDEMPLKQLEDDKKIVLEKDEIEEDKRILEPDLKQTVSLEKIVTKEPETVSSEKITSDLAIEKTSSGKSTPDFKDIALKDKSQVSSGKVTPELVFEDADKHSVVFDEKHIESVSIVEKVPFAEFDVKSTSSVPSEKFVTVIDKPEPVFTDQKALSQVSSGRSSPEIIELTKDLLDTKKSPILSRKSTPEIVVDNEFVVLDRLSPERDFFETEQISSVTDTKDKKIDENLEHISQSTIEPTKSSVEVDVNDAKQSFEVLEKTSSDPKTTNEPSSILSVAEKSTVVQPKESKVVEVKEECIVSKAGPSGITEIDGARTEEIEISRKSTPDIADVVKSSEKEELNLGRKTPPTAPVSPVIKEKFSSLHDSPISKFGEVRSFTPASDDCDISSGQISRVLTTEDDDEKHVYTDDEEIPGSPLSATSQIAHSTSSQYDFEDSVRGATIMDPMSTSFYGALPDDPIDLSKDIQHVLEKPAERRASPASSSPSHIYEITTAKFSNLNLQAQYEEETACIVLPETDIMAASFIGSELPSDTKDDPIASWSKPLGLPSPAPINDNKGTPKKERKIPSSVVAKNKLNEDKKNSDSKYDKKGKKVTPVYVDLTYVPHNGNSNYSYVDFFKRVRARYYVFSGIEPSKEVYNALLEAKQTWDDKDLEVTIIPTYDTDVLGYWVAENEDLLTKYKIDLSPSASRCTINLQDHETSCSAYRLEFS